MAGFLLLAPFPTCPTPICPSSGDGTGDLEVRTSLAQFLKRHAGAGTKFSEAQMDWLRMIRDHLATSFTIERDDLELAPFDAHGGLGRMYALFGDRMDDVMSDMNEALAA